MFLATIFFILAVGNGDSTLVLYDNKNLNSWFESAASATGKADVFESAADGTTITITSAKIDMNFMVLKKVDHLEIENINQGAKILELPALETATTITIKNTQLTAVHLPKLKEIKELRIISNSDLFLVDIGSLKLVEKLDFYQNKQLPFSQFKWFYNDELLKINYRNLSQVECHISTKEFITIGKELRHCTHISGFLTIKGPDFEASDLKIRELNGCLIVENTQMMDLEFLRDTVIKGCKNGHKIRDNPRLCPIFHGNSIFQMLDSNGGIKTDGIRSIECYAAACPTGTEHGCSEFNGHLVVDDSNADLFPKLKTIRGGLHITNIRHHDILKLPELTTVISQTPPVIQINRNIKLKRIDVNNLKKIKGEDDDGSGYLIIITENSQDLESSDGRKCVEYIRRCTVIAPKEPEKPWRLWTNFTHAFWIPVGLWLGLIVLLSIGAQIWYFRIWQEEKAYWQQIEEARIQAKQEMYQIYREKRHRRRTKFWKKKAEENQKKATFNWQMNNQVNHITL